MNGIAPQYCAGGRGDTILRFKNYHAFTLETRTTFLMWLAWSEQQVPRRLNPPKAMMKSFMFNIVGCQMNGITPRYFAGCRSDAILCFKNYQDFTPETRTTSLMWPPRSEQQVLRCLNPPKVILKLFMFNIFGCQMNGITPRYCAGCRGDAISQPFQTLNLSKGYCIYISDVGDEPLT